MIVSRTAEVQDDLDVPVVGVLLGQGDVGGGGTLSAGVCIRPQGMGGALQAWGWGWSLQVGTAELIQPSKSYLRLTICSIKYYL